MLSKQDSIGLKEHDPDCISYTNYVLFKDTLPVVHLASLEHNEIGEHVPNCISYTKYTPFEDTLPIYAAFVSSTRSAMVASKLDGNVGVDQVHSGGEMDSVEDASPYEQFHRAEVPETVTKMKPANVLAHVEKYISRTKIIHEEKQEPEIDVEPAAKDIELE